MSYRDYPNNLINVPRKIYFHAQFVESRICNEQLDE